MEGLERFKERWRSYPNLRTAMGRELATLYYREPWWAEWWAATFIIIWAVWNLTFAKDFADTNIYAPIPQMSAPYVWQSIGLLTGLAQATFLLIDVRKLRRLSCCIASWWWANIFLLVIVWDWRSPGLPLYVLPIAINLFSIARLRSKSVRLIG